MDPKPFPGSYLTYGRNWPGYRTHEESGNRYRWNGESWIFSRGPETEG